MPYTCFEVGIAGYIARVILNRPEKRNSMVPAFWRELPEMISEIAENARARVIVISSTGPHFSSGLDDVATWNASMLEREEIFAAMRANAEGRPREFTDLHAGKT